MILAEAVYAVVAEADSRKVVEDLEGRFRVSREICPLDFRVYHDSFDWRIYRAGGKLSVRRSEGGFALRWESKDGTVRRQLAAMPGFVWDLPAGSLRDGLESILRMRRSLPQVDVRCRAQVLRILDKEEKTVVRVRLEQSFAVNPAEGGAGTPSPVSLLRVLPVRGYVGAYRRLRRFIEGDLGLGPAREDELMLALAAAGRVAGDYKSKVKIPLDARQRSDEATKTIFRSLLHTMEANEDGLRQDLDSEFLHDFRVAVRRTRSALSQIKGVLPVPVVERFKGEFKWLGNATGPLRDLDVYLLKIPAYRAELPPEVRQDLEPLAAFLASRQRTAHRRLVAVLNSERYRELIQSWGEIIQPGASQPVAARPEAQQSVAARPNADRPILDLASLRIWRVYRKVLKEGRAIGPETPAEALHDLRIRCKKLRYLLEFFRSLYDPQVIDPLIKRLKLLQDNLGDFNDYEIQQDSLKEFAGQMKGSKNVPAATLMAMGRLVEHLEAGQAKERRRFHKCFERFEAEDNRRRFRRLFRPARQREER